MDYTIEVTCWSVELQRECRMRLTYRREPVPERDMVRDFLLSAELVRAAEAA